MKLLRWILFLPVAAISSIILSGLFNIVLHWSVVGIFHLIVPKWKFLTDFLSATVWFSAGIVTPMVWMTVGLKVAPRPNKFAKWFLLIPLILMMAMSVIGSLFFSEYASFSHVSSFSMNPKIGQMILSITAFLTSIILVFSKFSIEEDY